MGDQGLIAVVDIGKSNAKLTLTDARTGAVTWATDRPTAPIQRGPVRDLGVEAIWDWLRDSLGTAPDRAAIRAIVPVAHGAAVALLDEAGDLVCAPDYEDPVFDAVADAYAAVRDSFAVNFSPVATHGLNVGRQLYFLQTQAAELFGSVRHIVTYPQYWAWKLSGVLACEATALGAHTDLWLPGQGAFSPMVARQGWTGLFAPLRRAADVLGVVRPDLAARLGLDASCQVLCGIHDSNASYLSHRAGRTDTFAVVSSGTWTIVMAHGADLARLSEASDMLANVDAFGDAVATARFMGGREYAAVAGPEAVPPDAARLPGLIASGAMALPSFALGGPFASHAGRLIGGEGLHGTGRASLASLYLALVVDAMLDLLGAAGEVIVDGPLSQNAVFGTVLAALRPADRIRVGTARAGTLAGARRLVRGDSEPPPTLRDVAATELAGLPGYRARWRALTAA